VEQSEIDKHAQRISKDVLTATGLQLGLKFSRDVSQGRPFGDEWWDCETSFNGERGSGFGTFLPSGAEGLVAYLADYLQEHFSQEIWGGWPICPDHETHPLVAELEMTATAVWKCPKGRVISRIGDLPPSS
jgi:hypothetical protein